MNTYITIELQDFEQRLAGYNMLFNYRMANFCVKADPLALLAITVVTSNIECNLEEVAYVKKQDDYSFDVWAKNPNSFKDIIKGVLEVHPEFKVDVVNVKNEDDKDEQHAIFTMPDVNKDRRDLLIEMTKTFYNECKTQRDAEYVKVQERLVEPFASMPPQEVDEARKAIDKLKDEYKQDADKLRDVKLKEIEDGYQRYLQGKTNGGGKPGTGDAGKAGAGDAGKKDGGFDVTSAMKLPK